MSKVTKKKQSSGKKIAAFFDLDHTLLQINCGVYYSLHLVKRLRAPPRVVLHLCIGGILYLLFLYSPEAFLRRQVQYLRGISVAAFTKYADEVFAHNPERFFRPGVVRRYLWHKEHDHRVFIITQSYDILAQYFARLLKPDALISTELGIKDGKFTGDAHFCISDHKHKVVLDLARRYHLNLDKSYAYTDSVHDIRMLRLVGNVVVVNPKIRLSAAARKRGWKILKVRRVRRS